MPLSTTVGIKELIEAMVPLNTHPRRKNGGETRNEGIDVDEIGQAWRAQALQQRTPLIGFVEKENTTAGLDYDRLANDNGWLKRFPWCIVLDLTIRSRDAKRSRRCRR